MTGTKPKKKRNDLRTTLFAKFLKSEVSADKAAEYAQWWVDEEQAGAEIEKLNAKLACLEQTTTMGVDGAEEKADRIAEIHAQIEAMRGGHGAEFIRKRRENIEQVHHPEEAGSTLPAAATAAEIQQPQVGAMMSHRGLVNAYFQTWPTIKSDLKDAARNGLAVAKAGKRGWVERKALEWARSKGKLTADIYKAEPASNPDPMAAHYRQLAALPRKRHSG